MKRKLLIALGLLFVLGCLALTLAVINSGITVPGAPSEAALGAVNLSQEERAIQARLRSAPWQGLRYLPQNNEWRFYGVTGEQRQIELNDRFDLIKIYYTEADGDLTFTWAALGLEIPGHGYTALADPGIQAGDLVGLSLAGDYVSQNGVSWEDCKNEVCRAAQMIDTLLVLDDRGTGISNGFIREGWLPPTYPMYGFLCWQVKLAGNPVARTQAEGAR